MIELVKKLINFEVDDEVIEFYLANAINAIRNYINDDTVDVEETYPNEVVELTVFFINKAQMLQGMTDNGAIKSISSAGRSVTFMSFEELSNSIPDYILARLKRKVKVKVW